MFQTTNQDITMRIHRYTYVDQYIHGIVNTLKTSNTKHLGPAFSSYHATPLRIADP